MAGTTQLDALAVARALRRGPATLDALAARLDDPDRDALTWAVDDALTRGWVTSTGEIECGAGGLCGDMPPTLYSRGPGAP